MSAHAALLVIILNVNPVVIQIVDEHHTLGECYRALTPTLKNLNEQNPPEKQLTLDRLACMEFTVNPKVDELEAQSSPPNSSETRD